MDDHSVAGGRAASVEFRRERGSPVREGVETVHLATYLRWLAIVVRYADRDSVTNLLSAHGRLLTRIWRQHPLPGESAGVLSAPSPGAHSEPMGVSVRPPVRSAHHWI